MCETEETAAVRAKPPRFITAASHEGPGLDRYRASLARFGIVPDIVWTGHPYPGHAARARLVLERLRTLPEDEIVVHTDCFDVVLIRDPAELVARFLAFGAPIVISTEPGFTWKLPARLRASRSYPKAGGKSGM